VLGKQRESGGSPCFGGMTVGVSLSERGLPEESVKRCGRRMVFLSWRRAIVETMVRARQTGSFGGRLKRDLVGGDLECGSCGPSAR